MIEPVNVPIILDLELEQEELDLSIEEAEEYGAQLASLITINEVYGGLPSGGVTGNILVKNSEEDYDASWYAPASIVEDGNGLPVTSDAVYDAVSVKYTKPSDGIPKSDLEAAVQSSLDKADTALQEHQDISGKLDITGGVMLGNINMHQNWVKNIHAATAPYDAVNLKQVQTIVTDNAATYRGSFQTKQALITAPWQNSDPEEEYYVDANDFAIVQADESNNNECWRYTYARRTGWTEQYKINDAPLSQAQIDALNSGITTVKVQKLDTIEPSAEVNIIEEIRAKNPVTEQWVALPVTNKGVNLPEVSIQEEVYYTTFTIDELGDELVVTSSSNIPSEIIGIATLNEKVIIAKVSYNGNVFYLPLSEAQEDQVPWTCSFAGEIAEGTFLRIQSNELSWVVSLFTAAESKAVEIALSDLSDAIDSKYTKPEAGIPASDLANDINLVPSFSGPAIGNYFLHGNYTDATNYSWVKVNDISWHELSINTNDEIIADADSLAQTIDYDINLAERHSGIHLTFQSGAIISLLLTYFNRGSTYCFTAIERDTLYKITLFKRQGQTNFTITYSHNNLTPIGIGAIAAPVSPQTNQFLRYNGSLWDAETVTASDIGAYAKPSTGIPLEDLADNVPIVPSGGTTWQVLKKFSNNDWDVDWADDFEVTIFDFIYDADNEVMVNFPTLDEVQAAGPGAVARFKFFGTPDEIYIPVADSLGNFFGVLSEDTAYSIYYANNTWLYEELPISGGTSDYADLTNKPQINSVTLSGNKSLSDLGIEPEAFVVTITQSGSTYSADKTYSDTAAAISAGKRVVAVLNGYEYQLFNYVPNSYTIVFSANQGTTAKTIAFSLGDVVTITENALGTYSKPSGGIPATDLASAVQTSLGKADASEPEALIISVTRNGSTYVADKTYSEIVAAVSAEKRVVAIVDGIECRFYRVFSNTAMFSSAMDIYGRNIEIDNDNHVFVHSTTYGTYSKPSGGIPKTDLASAVQTSLGKADTALQPGDVAEPYFVTYSTSDGTTWSCDKTYAQIVAALSAEKDISVSVMVGANRVAQTCEIALQTDGGTHIELWIRSSRITWNVAKHYSDETISVTNDGLTYADVDAVAANQGVSHAGDFLVVGNDGNVDAFTIAIPSQPSDIGAYALPSGGIPKTDLTIAIQSSLDKADSALQSAPVTSVNGQTGVVSLSIPSNANDVSAIPAPASASQGQYLVYDNGWSSQDRLFIVTLTPVNSDYSGTMNASLMDIEAALAAGYEVAFDVVVSASEKYRIPQSRINFDIDNHILFISFYFIDNANDVLIFGETSGSYQYSTEIWPLAHSVVTSINNQNGDVTLAIPSNASDIGAVSISQGSAHAGEFLVVGSDGNITTVTMSIWQGGNY